MLIEGDRGSPPGATTTGVPKGDPISRYDNGMGAYVYVFADGSEETDWGGYVYKETPKAASGGGSAAPHGQLVEVEPGVWQSIDPDQIGATYGTATVKAPVTQSEVMGDGKLYDRIQNPDGTWGDWTLSKGQPAASPKTSITSTGKGGTIAITENPDGTFTTTTIIPDQADPPKTQVIDGVLYQYDEVSKEWKPTGVGTSSSAAALANTQMSIAANAAENAAGRAFTAGENAANRAFQSEEAAAAREFTAKENALGRKLDAEQFAAQFGLDKIRFLAEVDKNRAEAAAQFAGIVSSTDPSALPGYLAAQGGGSLSNAVAAGGDMITDAALLPAARMLGLARKEAPALPTFDAGAWAVGGGGGGGGSGGSRGSSGRGGRSRTGRKGRESRFGDETQGDSGEMSGFGSSQRTSGLTQGAFVSDNDWKNAVRISAAAQGRIASETTTGMSTAPDGRMFFTDKRGNTKDLGYGKGPEQGVPISDGTWQGAPRPAAGGRLLPVIAAAEGFTGTVTKPTVFVAGEGGRPENVNIAPASAPRPSTSTLTGAISGYDQGGTPTAPLPAPPSPAPQGDVMSQLIAALAASRPGTTPRPPASTPTPQAPGAPSIGAPPPPAQGAAPGAPSPTPRPPQAPGAPIGAPPTTGFGQPAPATGAGGVAAGLGAAGYGLGGYVPTAEERALMDEVRGIRTGVKLPWEDERYFNNVAWANEDPILQQMMMKGLQAKRGIPQESLWAEARRNALSGLGRQAVGIGY